MTPEELQKELENLLKNIQDFVGNEDKIHYIFRGETKKHPEISSNLYRHYKEAMGSEGFDIGAVQSHVVGTVRKHIREEGNHNPVLDKTLHQGGRASQIQEKNNVILEQLQHYGGKTNQIDFSSDYLIALFFACEAEPEEEGRLILLNTKNLDERDTIYKPKTPQNRVIVQKSVFVRSHSGVVKADEIMPINKELKEFIRAYLDRYHSINVENIYNDIHGFIYRYKNYEDSYTDLHLGLAHYDKGNYETAIGHYTKALKHGNRFIVYNHRGIAHAKNGDNANAIKDFTQAIEQDKDYIESYLNRSMVYDNDNQHDLAIIDCDESIKLSSYVNTHFNRAISYNRAGKHAFAIDDLNIAIKWNPINVDIRDSADIEKTMRLYEGAKENFETILNLATKQKNEPLADLIQKIMDAIPAESELLNLSITSLVKKTLIDGEKSMKTPPKVFITYSHKNADKRKRLEKALAVMINKGEIEIWSDAEILLGDKWEREIAEKMKESDILLYLVSADSLASKNCNKELSDIFDESPDIEVIPIILDDCDFLNHPLAEFEALPTKNKDIAPISDSRWKNSNEAWQNVVEGIKKKIANVSGKPTPDGTDTPPTPKELQPTPLTREQESVWFFNRANFFLILENNDLAIAYYTKAIELNLNYAEAYANRGIAKVALPDIKEARKDLETALPLAEKQGKKDLAARIQKAIDKLPKDSD